MWTEALLGDDFIVEDECKQEFSCPFCAEEFDIVGLVCHIDEEHQVEVKHGVTVLLISDLDLTFIFHSLFAWYPALIIQVKSCFESFMRDDLLWIMFFLKSLIRCPLKHISMEKNYHVVFNRPKCSMV